MNNTVLEKVYQLFKLSSGVSTDTRSIGKDSVFFCLRGEHYNANEFALEALKKGALAVVVDEPQYAVNEQIILVDHVLTFLQKLANHHRSKFQIPIIGITGTNGKTTTKELVTIALRAGLKTHSTSGNLNNHIGVPLTLLSMPHDTEIAVIEMGANHQREIAELCKIAEPNYGMITNIGKAHLEGFGGFQGVINTKKEMYDYIRAHGKAVFVNGDDPLLMQLSEGIDRITYGQNPTNMIFAEKENSDLFLTLKMNNYTLKTQLLGEYNFSNIVAAIAISNYFGVKNTAAYQAIENYKPSNKRSQLVKSEHNTLYLDAYNANPTSMHYAILSFLNLKETDKIFLLGDMLELGEESITEHQEIVNLLVDKNQKNVILIGPEFLKTKPIDTYLYFTNTSEAANFLKDNSIVDKFILIKGSRGIGLETLLTYL